MTYQNFMKWSYASLKKGDLHLPKNCKPIFILDQATKVISVITIADRCQSVLKLHGLDEQKGYTDATFPLKLALQYWKEFSLDTWVVFDDLVKAFGTVNKDMLMKIIAHYRILDSLISVIKCLYQSATIKFTWGKNKHAFPSLVGVTQCDNLAPILFLFVMQAAWRL